jgi:hypothetical protein
MENIRYEEGREGDVNTDGTFNIPDFESRSATKTFNSPLMLISLGLYYKYGYESALKNSTNKIRLKLQKQVPLNVIQHERIHSGNSYYMHNEELHRIYIPKEKFVSLFFWEYRQIEYTPILYSKVKQNEEMSMEGFYVPFKNEKEAIDLIDEVIERIKRE